MTLVPYKTLRKRGHDEFIVNKSRFIADSAPVSTEEDALAFLGEIRARYKDASHHCYAYIIGRNMGVMRYSDDGEPGGTAGMPIIEVMKARGVTDCVVVVTRYFGGILLGAGGLVRAYSQGAACGVNAGQVGVMHPTERCLMDVPYPMLGKVEYYLKSAPVQVEDKQFADVITLTLLVRCADQDKVLCDLAALSDGTLEPLLFEETYLPWPEEEEQTHD